MAYNKSEEVWGEKKTIYKGRMMMQIAASLEKIKLGEAAEIIRVGEREMEKKKTRLNTQCTRKIGHILSTNLEPETQTPSGAARG